MNIRFLVLNQTDDNINDLRDHALVNICEGLHLRDPLSSIEKYARNRNHHDNNI